MNYEFFFFFILTKTKEKNERKKELCILSFCKRIFLAFRVYLKNNILFFAVFLL